MSEKKREPLFHISKRAEMPWYAVWGVRVAAVVLALAVCAVISVVMTGENPLEIFNFMTKGAFGSVRKTWVTFQDVAMLLIISLAVTPAFKMKFWNLGGEGQALMGCLASAACMISEPNRRISSLRSPTAFAMLSERKELEQTSSASPSE